MHAIAGAPVQGFPWCFAKLFSVIVGKMVATLETVVIGNFHNCETIDLLLKINISENSLHLLQADLFQQRHRSDSEQFAGGFADGGAGCKDRCCEVVE